MSDRDTPRQRLLDVLMVERFAPYRPPAPDPPTAEEVAQHLRLVIDNTKERRDPA